MDLKSQLTPILAVTACVGIALLIVSLFRAPANHMTLPLFDEVAPVAPEGEANGNRPLLDEVVTLPSPDHAGNLPVEAALAARRSVRAYSEGPLHIDEISQLLWSAAGISCEETGYRTAPSAGATFPLELYLVVGDVVSLSSGLYHYETEGHRLRKVSSGDLRTDLYAAALQQAPIRDAPALLILSAVYERTTRRYGQRGVQYVHMEAGHAAQNVYLQAVSLGLGTVVIGAFDEERVLTIMGTSSDETPLYIMPIGRL